LFSGLPGSGAQMFPTHRTWRGYAAQWPKARRTRAPLTGIGLCIPIIEK